MKVTESFALGLIRELKSPGRQCIYDTSLSSYKNNFVKQNVWSAIAKALGVKKNDCQVFWKALRRRHKSALKKSAGTNGVYSKASKGFTKAMFDEMEYFLQFQQDEKINVPIICSDSSLDSFQAIELTNEDPIKTSMVVSIPPPPPPPTVVDVPSTKRDPFFLAIEEEFAKVPDSKRSILKVQLLSLIVECQN